MMPAPMAMAKPEKTSFMISASAPWTMRTPFGRSLRFRQVEHVIHRVAELHAVREVGAEHDAALAVVALDGGGAFAEADLGDGAERHRAAVADGHGERFRARLAGAGSLLRAGRGSGAAGSPVFSLARLASTSPMVATRIVSEITSVVTPRSAARSRRGCTKSSGRVRPVDGATLMKLETRRMPFSSEAAPCASSSGFGPVTVIESSRSPRSLTYQARTSGTVADDLRNLGLELLLRERALGLRRQADDDRRLADLARAGRRGAAHDEYRLDLRQFLEARHDVVGDHAGVFELGARRQFGRDDDARRSSFGTKPVGSKAGAPDRHREQHEAGEKRQPAVADRGGERAGVPAHQPAVLLDRHACAGAGDRPPSAA